MVIVEGAAEVRTGGQVIRTPGPGDFVGEIALVTDFGKVLHDSPSIRAKVQQEAFDRMRGPEAAQPDSP